MDTLLIHTQVMKILLQAVAQVLFLQHPESLILNLSTLFSKMYSSLHSNSRLLFHRRSITSLLTITSHLLNTILTQTSTTGSPRKTFNRMMSIMTRTKVLVKTWKRVVSSSLMVAGSVTNVKITTLREERSVIDAKKLRAPRTLTENQSICLSQKSR